MCGPGLPGFGLDMGETGAGRGIRDPDEMLAGGALNLPPRVARVAFQRLIAVGTIEFEFVRAHRLHPDYTQTGPQKYNRIINYYF